MLQKSTILVFLFTLLLGANVASAQRNGELTYAQFVTSCQNPGAFGHQRPPQSIKVDCKNSVTVWEPVDPGAYYLSESRTLTSEVFSDKYHVSVADYRIDTPDRSISCPRLREMVQRVTVEKAITCEQILESDQGLEALCTQVIDEAIAGNPSLVTETATGRIFNLCSDEGQNPNLRKN